MSKIKHLIHKVASSPGRKRGPSESAGEDEAPVEVAGGQNTVRFAQTNGGGHPPPQGGSHHHGRKRNRSLSLTEERALRCEVREAAEEREKQRQVAEKNTAYDDVHSPSHVARFSTKLEYTQDPLKDNYGNRPFTNQKSGGLYPPIGGGDASMDHPLTVPIERKSERIAKLSREDAGRRILFKARVHHARALSKHILFLVLRQNIGTIQGVLTKGETVSRNMLLWAETIHVESVVWVEGVLQTPQNKKHEVEAPSVRDVEVRIEKVCPTPGIALVCDSLAPVVSRVFSNRSATIPSRGRFPPRR